MKNIKLLYVASIFLFFSVGCERFLDEKTDKKLVVPSRLDDLQALLDNDNNINISDPGDGEISSDDFYLTYDSWTGLFEESDRRAYIWEDDFTTTHYSWTSAYQYVYYANVILEHLEEIREQAIQTPLRWENIAGQAYFLRARGHLVVQLIWAKAFDENTADADNGVPLRLNADFNIESYQASNRDVYAQIINDLERAVLLLPESNDHPLRASKPAAYALLSRTHLFMRDYAKSRQYADSCLQLYDQLIDYNNLDKNSEFPIPQFNREVLHHSIIRGSQQPLQRTMALVDSNLHALYEESDLRREIFFKDNGNGTHTFKGSYNGNPNLFSGITVGEVYLMRAEGNARMGLLDEAMADLNHLLSHRYDSNSFTLERRSTKNEVLDLILKERRKELLLRGIRFPDVKRLNLEGKNIEFKRVMNGMEYTLPPNDPRFALWIPETVLERAPNIVQNPR